MSTINIREELEDLNILLEFEQGIITERPYDPTLQEGKINYDIRKMIIANTPFWLLKSVLNCRLWLCS
jgi:hypothetical protein